MPSFYGKKVNRGDKSKRQNKVCIIFYKNS